MLNIDDDDDDDNDMLMMNDVNNYSNDDDNLYWREYLDLDCFRFCVESLAQGDISNVKCTMR